MRTSFALVLWALLIGLAVAAVAGHLIAEAFGRLHGLRGLNVAHRVP